jgi:hypothetical protein
MELWSVVKGNGSDGLQTNCPVVHNVHKHQELDSESQSLFYNAS